MEYQQLLSKSENGITWITFNRPDKLNAFTEVMINEFRKLLEKIRDDQECRVIVVSGKGRSWSAGVDLSIFEGAEIGPGNSMWEDGIAIMEMLQTMPQVTIAMLNGFCYTGALEILMAFDLIYAAEEASIGDTHAKWGIPPKWGMTQRLMRQIGIRKAKELSFTAMPILGKEAERIGLVNKTVPLIDLKDFVEKIANQIISNSAQTVSCIKKLYHFGALHSLKEGLDFERDFKHDITDKSNELRNFKNKI